MAAGRAVARDKRVNTTNETNTSKTTKWLGNKRINSFKTSKKSFNAR